MKKIISILITFIISLTLCSCSCDKSTPEQQSNADFLRTAGVWREGGANETPALVMDGAGAVTSLYPDGSKEFDGYLGYDPEEDSYAIYTDNDEFITDFYFDSDIQLHIGDDTEFIYIKSDDAVTYPVLSYKGAVVFTPTTESHPDKNGEYYYTYLDESKTLSCVNACFASTIENSEIIEQYIVRCIGELCEGDINNVVIEENIEYTNKIGEHVYIVSWSSKDINWYSFFFNTDTHTYMYCLSSPSGKTIPYESIFSALSMNAE